MCVCVSVSVCLIVSLLPVRPDQVSEGVTLLVDAQSSKTHIPAKMLIESLAVSSSPPLFPTLP